MIFLKVFFYQKMEPNSIYLSSQKIQMLLKYAVLALNRDFNLVDFRSGTGAGEKQIFLKKYHSEVSTNISFETKKHKRLCVTW